MSLAPVRWMYAWFAAMFPAVESSSGGLWNHASLKTNPALEIAVVEVAAGMAVAVGAGGRMVGVLSWAPVVWHGLGVPGVTMVGVGGSCGGSRTGGEPWRPTRQTG